MNAHDKREWMMIAKNTGLSIGVFFVLAVAIFFGGVSLGKVETKIETHESLDSHEGTKDLFVPKGEVDLQFASVQRQLNELKAWQKEILKQIKASN